jgi:hypothetical protein
VKDATVKVFHDPDIESLKAHVLAFVTAYTFAKHLRRLPRRLRRRLERRPAQS